MRTPTLAAVLLLGCALEARAQDCVPDPLADLQLEVVPSTAPLGEPVTLTLTNTSSTCTYTLPTSCLFNKVAAQECDGDLAYHPPCAAGPQPLGPGASVSAVWDQTYFSGLQVPEGVWALSIPVQVPGALTGALCAQVQVGFGCASPVAYGLGSAGSGGQVPNLSSLGGAPALGNADFQLALTNGLGGASAVVLGSLAPAQLELGFGSVLIDPELVFLSSALALSGAAGVAGQGIGFLATPIPDAPALLGLELWFQAAVLDPAAVGGLALSQGVRAALCA